MSRQRTHSLPYRLPSIQTNAITQVAIIQNNTKKEENTMTYKLISREMLIQEIAEKENIEISDVRHTFEGMEDLIYQYLASATADQSVTVKPFSGISITSTYRVERDSVDPKTRKKIVVPAKIWSVPRITRYYNRSLNKQKKDKQANEKKGGRNNSFGRPTGYHMGYIGSRK